MRSNDRDEYIEAVAALGAAMARCVKLRPHGVLTGRDCLVLLEGVEVVSRQLPAVQHDLIGELEVLAGPAELGGTLGHVLADRLRISRAEARRRIGEAQDLGSRVALSGQLLGPRLAGTAAAQRAGVIGGEQVRVIRGFLTGLPGWVDGVTRQRSEAKLAELGGQFRPEQLRRAAQVLANVINPDGTFSEQDRARRRGLLIGPQDPDGMSAIRGWLTPELRAGLEAVLAKWAAPGMCNPADETAVIDGDPGEEAAGRDARSSAQRNHDALNAMVRAVLCSGQLGSHRGLPVSIIVTARLEDLQATTGVGISGGGSVLPIGDVIRLARHAHHYLSIFDGRGRPLWLGQTKRLASPEQRIVLHALDRGCSAPGCDVPGYLCEVHHVEEWAECYRTDIDNLTFACGPHHRLLKPGGWTTRKRADGRTEWIPPPHHDRGQPRTNTFHHPEELLGDGDGDDPA
ncbi:MAG: HNH endonuclease [Mycolicibacterium sp.]|nr:HNH endonuclease [Mycolicibacterium sp.]